MNFKEMLFNADNYTKTANMAVTHKTSKSAVLDLFSQGGAARGWTQEQTISLVDKALAENTVLATIAIFYLADIRGGQGERRFFQIALNHLAKTKPRYAKAILPLLSEYSRWDAMYAVIGTKITNAVLPKTSLADYAFKLLHTQFKLDLETPTPSLLGKWLKSENASSNETQRLGKLTARAFGMSLQTYRKATVLLRKRIGIVETLLSQKDYDHIDYSKLSSQAGMKYVTAFFKHDEDRYKAYLDELKKPVKERKAGVKMNTSTLYPYELIRMLSGNEGKISYADTAWDNLPDYFENTDAKGKTVIPCIDVSASMGNVGYYSGYDSKGLPTPAEIAFGLGFYFAERVALPYRDMFLSFSERPHFNKLQGTSLSQKIKNLNRNDWDSNTNVAAMFRLILNTAIKNNVSQEDLPDSLLIISDMQFDGTGYWSADSSFNKTLHQQMEQEYRNAGYKLPNVIYWNVNATEGQSPVTKHQSGTVLVSGASPSAIGFVLGKDLPTPYAVMMDALSSERYNLVVEALSVVK